MPHRHVMSPAVLATLALTCLFSSTTAQSAAPCATHLQKVMDAESYDAALKTEFDQGFRPLRESISDVDGQPRFSALWVKDGGPDRESRGGLGTDAFYAASAAMIDYRTAELTVGIVAGQPYFSALFEKGRPLQQAVDYGLTEAELREKLTAKNRRVLAIAPYRLGDVLLFAAVFDIGEGLEIHAQIGLDAAGLDAADRATQKMGLVRVSARPYTADGHKLFAAVWQPADTTSLACADASDILAD